MTSREDVIGRAGHMNAYISTAGDQVCDRLR
ncbi:hypothetical protein HUW46_08205 [Amycolatopsis sp. CA-230715]|nr:hypothetical protein HUW46_08205 [Amycolatopsis sp. CA-230715]